MDLKSWLQKVPANFSFRHSCDASLLSEGTRKKFYWNKAISLAFLTLLALFLCSVVISENYAETASRWGVSYSVHSTVEKGCEYQTQRRIPYGSEPLPRGIVQETSNLEMRPLWGVSKVPSKIKSPQNLLAIAVGIEQKENVNKIVQKFPSNNFTVMLFHYDGIIDKWSDLKWNARAIHVAAINQTKWWFAKRFLHPDIVAEYNYIFLWDEDLGVENFHAGRYLAIMEDEGLEISQPGLDISKSEIHHRITVRSHRTRVHRRIYKLRGHGRCYENSTGPPCTGWVEMMAPVFSRDAWRCAWYMIQNDLVHAWGVDMKLGYCSQGDRTRKVGVIDSEYIVHQGIPSLGGMDKKAILKNNDIAHLNSSITLNTSSPTPSESAFSERAEIRLQSYNELDIFNRRWAQAINQDKCWIDPFLQTGTKPTSDLNSQTKEKLKNK